MEWNLQSVKLCAKINYFKIYIGTILVPDYQIFWIIIWHLIFLLQFLYLDCTTNQRSIPLEYLLQLLVQCCHEPLSVFLECVQFLSGMLKD